MTNYLPSILSGSQLQIRIGSSQLAFAQSLSFTHDMTIVPVSGIGSLSNHALEPVRYLTRGSMVITQYSDTVVNAISSATDKTKLPANMQQTATASTAQPNTVNDSMNGGFDGNSLFRSPFFNPVTLLLTASFDIDVYERDMPAGGLQASTAGALLYTIEGCRMNNYSLRFNVGSLLNETVSYLAMRVVDHRYTVA